MRRQTRCALVTVVQTCALPSSSVVAIVDQITGSLYGWIWLDPLMGIVGALVIAQWSWGLMRDTGATMLDYRGEDDPLKTKIRQVIAAEGDRITDLHVWQLGPGHHAVIVAVVNKARREPAVYRDRLLEVGGISPVGSEKGR